MGISIGELKPSKTIIYNKELYIILSCEHSKIARGSAFCRAKLKNLKTSQILDCTLRDSDNIKTAFVEKRKLQYLYTQDDRYHLLDLETYEDLILQASSIEEKIIWLYDNAKLNGIFYENKLLDIELPGSMILEVIKTEPGFRGDTVKAGIKSAKLETGLVINVPLFINAGDRIKVDTKTKGYLSRA